jgi:hypothetical protein
MTDAAQDLFCHLQRYAEARRAFLQALSVAGSNRDPLAEFAERLAAVLLGGKLADSRTQKGWDLELPDQSKVQVRYLANTTNRWVNEHVVKFEPGVSQYALLVIENLEAHTLIVFAADRIAEVGKKLKKTHADQGRTLQFTRRNYDQLMEEMPAFGQLGVRIFQLPQAKHESQ